MAIAAWTLAAVVALKFVAGATALYWPRKNRPPYTGLVSRFFLAASLIAAGLTTIAVTLAIPDPRYEPLEEILPENWRETTTQFGDKNGNQWEELFTREAREAEQLEAAIVQAIQSGAAVQAYVTVQEGDGRKMTSVLKHHIQSAGGYAADTSPYRRHIWAAVPKSYLPCLQESTTLAPDETPPTPYRDFAVNVFAQPHQCPWRTTTAPAG